MLNFGAIYYESEVYIDGKFVGRHIGGSDSFAYDISDYVADGKPHDLVVRANSDLRSRAQGAGKQSLRYNSFGCLYSRTTGIWQTVWVEATSDYSLEHVQVITDIDQRQVVIIPRYYNTLSTNTLTATISENGKTLAKKSVATVEGMPVVIPFRNFKTWSPEEPNLYDVEYVIRDKEGNIVDRIKSYLGMRKIHVDGNRIYLNNQPYYQRLVLDQGFYPDGNWTAPSDEALRRDIELSKAVGFNGARLHQKVFEEPVPLLGRQTRLSLLGRIRQLGHRREIADRGTQLPSGVGQHNHTRPQPPVDSGMDTVQRGMVARQRTVPASCGRHL